MLGAKKMYRSMVIAIIFLSACATADLRPKGFNPSAKGSEEKAVFYLKKMQDAHGGKDLWLSKNYAVYALRDYWPSWIMQKIAMPWEFSGQKIKVTSVLGSDDGRLEFMEGENVGTSWGVQNWVTYSKSESKPLIFKDDTDIKFWIPTIKYFTELPFRIVEAPLRRFIGRSTQNNKHYLKVYVTWNSLEPNDEYDQYILWINEQSYILEYVEYTVRDIMASVRGILYYYDYRIVDGIKIPFGMRVLENPDDNKSVMHDMVLETAHFTSNIENSGMG